MKFTLKVVGDVCVLKLDGKFMAGGDSFFLREKIKNVLSMGIEKLLIDMDNVPYIDSTGSWISGQQSYLAQIPRWPVEALESEAEDSGGLQGHEPSFHL